jgi:hypothetical protein
MLRVVNRLPREKTAATPGAARQSAAGEAFGRIDWRGTRGACSQTAKLYGRRGGR